MNEELNVDALTLEELKEQAKILGVDARGGEDRLREKIKEALGIAPADTTPAAEPKAVHRAEKGQKRHKILIPETERDTQPVQVYVNGRSYIIKRGEEAEVPDMVVEVLRNAKQRVYNPRTMESREVLSYPFQLLS